MPVPGNQRTTARPLRHYVLFGPAQQAATAANLLLARGFLLAFNPAFGFSPGQAACAEAVTIIGDLNAVPAAIEAGLAAGGARLQRIAGSPQEVAQALNRRVIDGRPF
jgi:hypothetical protein